MKLDLMGGWMFFQVFAVVGKPSPFIIFDGFERVTERHLAVTMVMAIRFAVGRDVNELIAIATV